ncbi:septum formation family protein [Georgenia subflava]|uniref:Septum formation-related domain-containing protein n=1 Tax=Georgenia subflava TaxID=1622177 RepID=A0A6N7EIE1_9MICO|nr:septum formation family protein [Georgenia subflava]MPV36385.1 hypothetical protein [Georgenia subflava]
MSRPPRPPSPGLPGDPAGPYPAYGQAHQGAVGTAPRPYGQSFGSGQPFNSMPYQRPSTAAGRTLGVVAIPVAVPLGPLGVVLGAISYTKARRGNGPTGPGIAAMIVGALSTLALTLFILTAMAAALSAIDPDADGGRTGQVPIGAMAVGDCALDLDGGQGVVELVDCAQWHQAETFAEVGLDGDYPGQDEVLAVAEDLCLGTANEMLPPAVDASGIGVATIAPDATAWDQGVTFARCVIVDTTGRDLMGSLAEGTLQTR